MKSSQPYLSLFALKDLDLAAAASIRDYDNIRGGIVGIGDGQFRNELYNPPTQRKRGRDPAKVESSSTTISSWGSQIRKRQTKTRDNRQNHRKTVESNGIDGISIDDCVRRKWHPDFSTSVIVCANSLDYPPAWNDPSMIGVMMFFTSDDCCSFLVDSAGGATDDCVVSDECLLQGDSHNNIETGGPFTEPLDSESDAPTSSPSPTREPTASPTEAPTKRISNILMDPEIAETPCISVDWHPNIYDFEGGCSNNATYPPDWDYGTAKHIMFFKSLDACCAIFNKEGVCAVEDVCGDDAHEPQNKENEKNTSSSSAACEHAVRWHLNEHVVGGCSNSPSYPDDWNEPPESIMFFYDSVDECCEIFAQDGDCDVEDVCKSDSQPEQPPTWCDFGQWHPTPEKVGGCSNSPYYPDEWNFAFFDDAEACCEIFAQDGDCYTDDVYATWHPDVVNEDGCSNSPEYPYEWQSPEHQNALFFDSWEACCEKFFYIGGRDCKVYDSCLGEPILDVPDTSRPTQSPTVSPTHSPTTSPTKSPSASPSNSPTSSPTKSPTSSPTLSPVVATSPDSGGSAASCESAKWHPTEDYIMCTNSFDFPAWWDTPGLAHFYFYESKESCCVGMVVGECPTIDICETGAPTSSPTLSPTSSPTSIPTSSPTTSPMALCEAKDWHITEDFSKCSNNFEYPDFWKNPAFINLYFFRSKEECCLQMFQKADCLVEDICSTLSDGTDGTNPSGKADTTCVSAQFHPDAAFSKCTNSFDDLEKWDVPGLSYLYLHATSDDCCMSIFRYADCPVEDICVSQE